MTNKQSGMLVGGLIGAILGSFTGVAFGGTAYNGALIFGVVGMIVGRSVVAADNPQPPPEDHVDLGPPGRSDIASETAGLTKSLCRFGAVLWNTHIDILAAAGIAPFMAKHPWSFFVLGLVMLALIFPLGAIYIFMAICAGKFDMDVNDYYRAKVTRGNR